jgi:hypothetical protein
METMTGTTTEAPSCLASTFVSAVLVARGAMQLRKGNRSAAYTSFDRAPLVAIFVTPVFAFFESQFGAVFGLACGPIWLGIRGRRRSLIRRASRPQRSTFTFSA